MNESLKRISLNKILTKSEENIIIQPELKYKQVTIKLWGKGVKLRDEVLGTDIGAKRRNVIRSGQFILSRIDARNGAFGIVPNHLDSAVVSNDFPSFNINNEIINPYYLEWLSKSEKFIKLCKSASEGTTNRVRLQLNRFLNSTIFLPSVNIQNETVKKVNNLSEKIIRINFQKNKVLKEVDELFESASEKIFNNSEESWEETTVGDLCEKPQYGFTSSAAFEPIGPKFLRITDIQNGKVNWELVPYCDCPEPEKYLLEENDILFARTGATTGKSYLVIKSPRAVFASYLIRLKVKKLVSPQYLYAYFQTPLYWRQIIERKTGTGQPNVNAKKLSKVVVPLPSSEEQAKIVKKMMTLIIKIENIKNLLRKNITSISELIPSILDNEFELVWKNI